MRESARARARERERGKEEGRERGRERQHQRSDRESVTTCKPTFTLSSSYRITNACSLFSEQSVLNQTPKLTFQRSSPLPGRSNRKPNLRLKAVRFKQSTPQTQVSRQSLVPLPFPVQTRPAHHQRKSAKQASRAASSSSPCRPLPPAPKTEGL
jgi:hypothetical protein